MGLAEALDDDGALGNLWAGTAALSEAFNVAGNLWVGPDSAKSNVSADSGRIYMATDTQVDYYGDSGSWVELGIGSASNPVPSVHTEEASITDPAGEAQLKFLGLDASNSIRDEDEFDLEAGVLIERQDDRYTETRLILGRDVYLGVRKNDDLTDLESGEGGSTEFLLNPASSPNLTLENDLDQGIFYFESLEGGGLRFRTSDHTTGGNTNDVKTRLHIIDPSDDNFSGLEEIHFKNTDRTGHSGRIDLYDAGTADPQGNSNQAALLNPRRGSNRFDIETPGGVDIVFEPGFSEAMRMDDNGKVTVAGDAVHTQRSSDPGTSEIGDGEATIYVSDGTAQVTGDDGDVILAVNSGGTVKTTTLADFSAL